MCLSIFLTATGHNQDDLLTALEEAKRKVEAGNIEGIDKNETSSFYFKRSGIEVIYYAIKFGDAVSVKRFNRIDEIPTSDRVNVIGIDEFGLAVNL